MALQKGVGAWVCSEDVESLAPALLIEALCPQQSQLCVRGRPTCHSAQAGRRSAEASLLYGVHNLGPDNHSPLLLFACRLDSRHMLKHESDLAEWLFPVPMAGVVVLTQKMGRSRLAHRAATCLRLSRRDTLGWAEAQGLPLVLGAMGIDAHHVAQQNFRKECGLGSGVRVVVGPAPARRRLPKGACLPGTSRFELASLLCAGELRFDEDYATRILSALCDEIGQPQEAQV